MGVKGIRKSTVCHPERQHFALGLCVTCYHQQNRTKNHERRLQQVRDWDKRNSGYGKKRYWLTRREEYLQAKYGIGIAQYDAMLEAQGGGCAICGQPPKKRKLHVDHDHKTGKVRGILCFLCNQGLGQFRDNIESIKKAAMYLEINGDN